MSDGVYDLPEEPRRARRTPGQRPRALLPTIATLIVLLILFSVFTDVWTQRLWYRSVDLGSVFSTVLGTRVLLFFVVGLLMAGAVVANVIIAFRTRPRVALAPSPSPGFERYGELLQQRGKIAVGVLGALMLVFGGSAASGEWKVFLAWRNQTPFGVTDKHFNMDISFFVFDYPWLRVLLGFGYSIVLLSLVAAIITHYLYGGFRPSAKGQKASGAAQVQFSVLLGLLVLLKAFSYWLDRYGLTVEDSRLFTGISYTGDNAVLPSKEILAVIALLCAVLFFANVVRRTWLLPGVGTVVLILSAILLGALWPAALQQLRVRPSEPVREAAYITKNIEATRQAYGLEKTKVTNYDAETNATPSQLSKDAELLPGIRLIDPSVVGPTFEQLQQVRGFYSFPTDLDVDRYKIGGTVRDTVIAVREVQVDRLPAGQRNWNNDHTVYTHGYGVVAAFGNQRANDGSPVWSEHDLPPKGQLGEYEPRIYFGEQSPDYSIVGAPKGSPAVELDTPEGQNGGDPTLNTYAGKGGVPVGSFFNKLLYATKFRDANILLSSRVNSDSKILYDRNPRERVEKAAPWLTPDGDPYPAVVDGQVVWIVDGYTTSANYPYSQKVALDDSTRDTTTGRGSIAQQPSEEINYIRNSVKAVVNAYDGSVNLYAWDENDPLLKTWMKAFPGTVKPRSEISPDLMAHLRYPEDIFKVQRDLLAKYHVQDSTTWYQNSDLWRVPADPTAGASTADSSVQKQPPFYLSLRMPDQKDPKFSLTSVYVPNAERENLTGFMAVDAEASSPTYGQFQILRLPGNVQIPGPGQVANKFQTDEGIRTALLPLNQPSSGARAQFGNLLTLPLGDGLLYVQPVYSVRTSGPGSYPVLRYVLVGFGDRVAFGASLQEALRKVFNAEVETEEQPGKPPTTTPPANQTITQALAEAQTAYNSAQAALRAGNLAEYQNQVNRMKAAIDRAVAAGAQVTPPPTTTPSPTGAPTTTPPAPTSPPTSPTG
ncbi:hypothetical protein EV643_122136 [Kribbella sp. VKM Ac-2527]|uniref:UPF0182 protein EV643_122136 n=1 Tax=Kribbella caucasensis TaxID=2512215 RepID=A0A4R6JM87_9ACTN|nr:UPF0182 family protein [Kribbella sp. VKM Ac-2527]TDO35725.1 hypothetical protein EV643_122136 [Kribbella sp. VKM Ac-2527]